MTRFTAIVLAGSRGGADALCMAAGVSHKALIKVGGQTMLERVVQTLLHCDRIGQILISVAEPELISGLPFIAAQTAEGRVQVIPASGTPGESVMAAIQSSEGAWPYLITTADHPLLRDDMIAYLLGQASADLDAVAGIVERAVIRAAYPRTSRTYLQFRDVAFSGANLFLLRRPAALGVVRFWRHIEANRKHPLRLMAALDIRTLLSFALGRLDLGRALHKLGEKCGARLGVVRLPYAEAAIDVDKESDLAMVTEMLG